MSRSVASAPSASGRGMVGVAISSVNNFSIIY